MSESRSRTKNLTEEDIDIAIRLLDGWDISSKLTWDHLITAIDFKTGKCYTRQALSKHRAIQNAYSATKNRLSKKKLNNGTKTSLSADMLVERNERLEAENNRLKMENEALLEQFVRWAYNAYQRGLTQDDLNKSLPPIDRR